MGEVILKHHVRRAGDLDDVEVSSAGTARWHVGEPMDHRAAASLQRGGYSPDAGVGAWATPEYLRDIARSEEHTSELQSH